MAAGLSAGCVYTGGRVSVSAPVLAQMGWIVWMRLLKVIVTRMAKKPPQSWSFTCSCFLHRNIRSTGGMCSLHQQIWLTPTTTPVSICQSAVAQEAETVQHHTQQQGQGQNAYSRHGAAPAGQPAIVAQSASFAWERQGAPPSLHSISLKAMQGQLVMVVGVVGSGKSSLIAALLGELHSQGGSLQVSCAVLCMPWVTKPYPTRPPPLPPPPPPRLMH